MLWKFFILAFSIGLVSADRNPLERVKRSVDNVHRMVLNERLRLPLIRDQIRHKRQIRTIDNDDDDATFCLLNCANQLQRAAARYQNDDEPTTGANRILKPSLNLTRLTNVCQAMRPPLQCFDRCPRSDFQTQLKTSLEPIRFICVDRYQDFMSNLRCMHKLDTTASNRCTPKCRRYESAVNKTMQLGRRPYLRHFYTIDELKEMLSGTCQFVQCYMDCSVPLTRSVCGQTAADLASNLIQKMFASVQNYDKLVNGGSVLPRSCRRLAQPTGTEIAEYEEPGDDQEGVDTRYIEPRQDQESIED
jgi:hypothetical protein